MTISCTTPRRFDPAPGEPSMKKYVFGTGLALSIFLGAWGLVRGQAPIDEETKKQARAAIENYVKKDVELKQSFLLVDPRSGKPLQLTFDHVHGGVKPHAEGLLACVDFKDATGNVYDVDVVVAGAGGKMAVKKVFLHKVDGEPVTEKASSAR